MDDRNKSIPETTVTRSLGYITRVLIFAACAYVAAARWFPEQRRPDSPYFNGVRFDAIAHRGGAARFPENTLAALRSAHENGADVLEMDLRPTRDGTIVLMHDETVDRTTNGSGRLADMDWSELRTLDAGYRHTESLRSEHAFRDRGVRVPALEQVLTAFPEARFNMELKDRDNDYIDDVCELIKAYDAESRVLMGSFHHVSLTRFRMVCPEVATGLSFREALIFYNLYRMGLARLFRSEAVALQIPERFQDRVVVTKQFMKTAHRQNRRVHVWTVNELPDMRRLMALNVDGLLTDHPSRLVTLRRKLERDDGASRQQ